MNFISYALIIFLSVLFITLGTCTVFWYVNTRLLTKSKLKNESFESLMVILSVIINTELDEYDLEIFAAKGSISNQNFEAFYKDICGKIIANISRDLITELSKYTTEENIYRIVARRTKKYLREKIVGTV